MPKEPHPAWVAAVMEASPEIARLATWGASNMTGLEKTFWKMVGKDANPWGLIPQFPARGYVLDFYSPSYKVAVELDGPAHHGRLQEDRNRDKILAKEEMILTVRLTRADLVKHGPKGIYDYLNGVFEAVERPAPPPPPPPAPEPPPPPPPGPRGPDDIPF